MLSNLQATLCCIATGSAALIERERWCCVSDLSSVWKAEVSHNWSFFLSCRDALVWPGQPTSTCFYLFIFMRPGLKKNMYVWMVCMHVIFPLRCMHSSHFIKTISRSFIFQLSMAITIAVVVSSFQNLIIKCIHHQLKLKIFHPY